jgi:hypothetical protein
MAAEPARQPAPTVGRGLGMAVGLCAAPCVFGVYYDSPYTFPYLPIEAWGLVGLAASAILGLVAARLARWPRLAPTAVGLLAGVVPGVYLGLEASTAVSPESAAAAMATGSLACVIIGGAVGLGAGIMAQREGRRAPWLGHAGLGLALGASAGLYLSSIVFMHTVTNAKQINLLIGGAIGLALGFAAARSGHNRPWLGRAGLGLAVGCCLGIWAYHEIHGVDGLFGPFAAWTVWPALGGAAGLAWAGRSGAGRLQPVAAGLAAGACTGASVGLFTCLSTGCFQASSGISTWSLIGSLVGGVLGVAIGALGHRRRLSSAALGLAIGALFGDSAFIFNTGTHYQGSLDAAELGWRVIAGVFGMVVGWLAADAGDRLAAFGLGFGGWVGAWAGAIAAFYAIVPGGADRGGIVGMLVGGLVGLMIALRAGRLHFGYTALGVAVGAFVGARFADPGGQSPLRGIAGMVIGGCIGLILCLRCERAVIASMPGLALGTVIGAWAGASVLAGFPVPTSPIDTGLICMTAGGLVGLMYVHGCRLMMAKQVLALVRLTGQVNPAPWQDVRLDRLTCLSRWLVGLAAAAASGTSETAQERYAEEFDGTLRMITGRFAPLQRLWCALSILMGALTVQIENLELEQRR